VKCKKAIKGSERKKGEKEVTRLDMVRGTSLVPYFTKKERASATKGGGVSRQKEKRNRQYTR